jgi:hypothetical protein
MIQTPEPNVFKAFYVSLQPSLIFVGKAKSLPKSGTPERLRTSYQTLGKAAKTCQGHTLKLITNIRELHI